MTKSVQELTRSQQAAVLEIKQVEEQGAPLLPPRLKISQIAACLRGLDVSLTLLVTSCYSGGWVLQRELNISAFTAAGGIISEVSIILHHFKPRA